LYENFAELIAIGNPLSLKLAKPILMSVKYPEQKYRVELLSMWEQGGELQALVEYVLEKEFLDRDSSNLSEIIGEDYGLVLSRKLLLQKIRSNKYSSLYLRYY